MNQKDYREVRASAQEAANADGFDRGLEHNKLFKTYNVFRLPSAPHRRGHELRCEVVSCMDLAKCQPGHGPGVR